MRITEIFIFGRYRGRGDRYHGGHYYRYGYGPPYGGYKRRSLDDRDTPIARLKGSSTF